MVIFDQSVRSIQHLSAFKFKIHTLQLKIQQFNYALLIYFGHLTSPCG